MIRIAVLALLLAGCGSPAKPAPPTPPPEPSPTATSSPTPTGKLEPVACECCWGLHLLPGAACSECGGVTRFSEHKLCDACSGKLHRCCHCGKAMKP